MVAAQSPTQAPVVPEMPRFPSRRLRRLREAYAGFVVGDVHGLLDELHHTTDWMPETVGSERSVYRGELAVIEYLHGLAGDCEDLLFEPERFREPEPGRALVTGHFYGRACGQRELVSGAFRHEIRFENEQIAELHVTHERQYRSADRAPVAPPLRAI
jgi:hypothetical protein